MTRRTEPGSDGWRAAQFWLAWTAPDSVDLPARLQRCAAVIDVIGDRQLSPMLVDCLALQATILSDLGRIPEAVLCGRRALAMACELGYPFGQVQATTSLVRAARFVGDLDDAQQLARQAEQIPDIPGTAAGRAAACWQITVIALAVALVTAATAVFLNRARASRRTGPAIG